MRDSVYKMRRLLMFPNGYSRKEKFVKAHWKKYPDNKTNNNRESILGY